MTLRIIAGVLGVIAGFMSLGYMVAGRWVPAVAWCLASTILELIATAKLPKGEDWRSLPRDDHYDG